MRFLNKTRLTNNLQKVIEYDISRKKTFGAAYCVYQEDNFAFEKCYGLASLDCEKQVARNTLFRIASMTKPITAIAILILVERGLISLEDPLDRFLPKFTNIRIVDDKGIDIGAPRNMPTIKNILSHTSGIGSSKVKMQHMCDEDKKTLSASVDFFVREGLDFEPTSKQIYSGMGAFDVLARIVEIVSGKNYLDFLKEEIFQPCKMFDTTFEHTVEQIGRLVDMHALEDGLSVVHKMHDGCIYEDFPCTHYLGGAGLVSTLQDYCNFAKMLLNGGKTDAAQLLSKEVFSQLCIPHVRKDIMPGSENWGLGVRVITGEDYPYLPAGSFGWSGAYGTHFWVDPTNCIFAVFMKNSKFDGGAANESAVNFERAVYSSFE